MTLHEAIVKVLQTKNKAMSLEEIADELNRNKWYEKKDKSSITSFQIHGRTRNYTHLFERNGSMVFLKGSIFNNETKESSKRNTKPIHIVEADTSLPVEMVEDSLLDELNFKSASIIDKNVPDVPGLYCIRIKDPKILPAPFNAELKQRQHNILYIGIATQSLCKRMLNQELRAKGHGTFFRSLGAVLGYRPPIGSLTEKKNKRNYTFRASDEREIITWINENLTINWVPVNTNFEVVEKVLISKYKPIINISKNPYTIPRLSELRKECVEIANKEV